MRLTRPPIAASSIGVVVKIAAWRKRSIIAHPARETSQSRFARPRKS